MQDYRDVLEDYVQGEFYDRVCRSVDLLSEVRDISDGHGIIFITRDGACPSLDYLLEESEPYNGEDHSIYDHDISEVVARNRKGCEGAIVIDGQGTLSHKDVFMEFAHIKYKRRHGIDVKLKTFMGYFPDEQGAGTGNLSALTASEDYGENALIIKLGENDPGEPKGEINIYFCGDRIYNSEDRQMHWEYSRDPPDIVKLKADPAPENASPELEEKEKAVNFE